MNILIGLTIIVIGAVTAVWLFFPRSSKRSGKQDPVVVKTLEEEQERLKEERDNLIEKYREVAEKEAKKALIVSVIIDFKDQENEREGAEKDHELIELIKSKVDHKVFDLYDNDTDGDFKALVRKSREEIDTNEDLALLFFIISTHGGVDDHGDFIYDEKHQRYYVNKDLIDEFSGINNKYTVFFVNACRTWDGNGEDSEMPKVEPVETKVEPIPNTLIVRPSPNSVSYRCPDNGSLSIDFLKKVIRNYGVTIPIQKMFEFVQKEYDEYHEGATFDYNYTLLEVVDTINKDIFLKSNRS